MSQLLATLLALVYGRPTYGARAVDLEAPADGAYTYRYACRDGAVQVRATVQKELPRCGR